MSETANAPAIDKSTWGPGPWQDEPDRVDFVHAGLACFVKRNHHGNLCGYVGVPREHPLYGKSCDDADLHVHGGITYADVCKGELCHVPEPGMPDDVWWLGFDCAHCNDLSPGTRALLHELKAKAVASGDEPAVRLWNPLRYEFREVYRELPYVRRECERLAEQLAALAT